MNWFFTYLRYWFRSLTELHFFIEVTGWSSWKLLRTVSISLLLISFFFVYQWQQTVLPVLEENLRTQLEESRAYYPENLEISWDGQELQLSTTEPLQMPNPWPSILTQPPFPATLAVVTDSSQPASELAANLAQPPLFMVTRDTLWVSDLQNTWSNIPLQEAPGFESPFTITAESYPWYVSEWQNMVTQASSVLRFLSFFLIPLSYSITKLLTLTFDSLLIFLLLKLFPASPSFKAAWHLTLQVGVVASFLTGVATLLYSNLNFDFFTLCFWVLLTTVLIAKRTQHWVWGQ